MKNRALVRRYGRGLIQSARDEREFGEIEGQLRDFLRFLREHEDLNLVLNSSLYPASRILAVAEDVMNRMSLHPKTARFILLLIKNGRLSILADLAENLSEMWNEENGILSFEVASVVPLSDGQKKRLKVKLEGLEQKPVRLTYTIEPGLIGGLSLRQGNVIYDVSLRGALDKLKEKISEG